MLRLLPCFSILCVGSALVLFSASGSVTRAAEEGLKTEAAKPQAETPVKDAEEIPSADESQAGPLAGHSLHGEAFNEGPRQKAHLMQGTGPIQFNVTTSSDEAADFVRQGMGQLHGYWYLEAERSFRQAAMLDPNCAIAYWGMAKANTRNSKRAKSFIAEAVERKEHAGRLEGMMIDALDQYLNSKKKKSSEKNKDYFAALEEMAKEFPDELEVKAARAYALYRYRSDLKKKHEDADKALNEVLAIEPLHPAHHFRIHLWDYKDAAKALDSAAKCGQSSPDIAHMWHMPGHIYSRLKRYSDGAWQQEASARVDHAHMMRDRVMPDEIHNFAHNNEWLIRNLGHTGRWRDAIDLAMNMTELPRHPKYNTFKKRGSAYYGRLRLFDELFRFEQWELLASLTEQPFLEPTDEAKEQLKRLRYAGIANARLKADDEVTSILALLDERLKEATEEKKKADAEEKKKQEAAEKKAAAEREKRRVKANKERRPEAPPKPETPPKPTQRTDPRTVVNQAIAAVKGHQLFAQGKFDEAISQLRKSAGDGLVLARAQSAAGKHDEAIKTLDAYLKSRQKRVQPIAGQVELLWNAGRNDEAAKAFEELRELSGEIQFGTPVFDRLQPIAAELKLPEDWRIAKNRPDDFGERPDLDSLGPFRWRPMPAEQWALKDTNGKEFSLKSYEGKPVIVIFYLGYACLHCAEQLQKFAPETQKFRDAGIEIIAISTDSPKDLKNSVDNYKGGMPFPLVSDEKLDVFKAWRVYDDFEQLPLHGTFLIDEKGLVRWQDISFEPFMESDFLLKESKRLLEQDSAPTLKLLNREDSLARTAE
jgi:peroxiredoxin